MRALTPPALNASADSRECDHCSAALGPNGTPIGKKRQAPVSLPRVGVRERHSLNKPCSCTGARRKCSSFPTKTSKTSSRRTTVDSFLGLRRDMALSGVLRDVRLNTIAEPSPYDETTRENAMTIRVGSMTVA